MGGFDELRVVNGSTKGNLILQTTRAYRDRFERNCPFQARYGLGHRQRSVGWVGAYSTYTGVIEMTAGKPESFSLIAEMS